MAENRRVVLASETHDDRKITLDELGTKIAVPVSIYDATGTQVTSFGGSGSSTVTIDGNTAVGDGTQTVTSAGARVQLSTSSTACKRVLIQALETNTGVLVVGGSTVIAASGSRRGYALYPTQSVLLTVSNLNLVYLDSTANGDVAHYLYEN